MDNSEGYCYGKLVIGSFITQHAHSCITSRAEYFCETSNHPGDSAPLQPRFGDLQLLAFPKTKITFEREEISDHLWDSGKYNLAADGDWENCVRSQGAYFEEDWGITVLCTMTCIFFKKSLYFIVHGWIPSGQTPYIVVPIGFTNIVAYLLLMCYLYCLNTNSS